MSNNDLIKDTVNKAKEVGFEQVGFTNFYDFDFYSKKLNEFIKNKKYGEMLWLNEKREIRANPLKIWPEARSAIVLGLNYAPQFNPMDGLKKKDKGYISVYARRKDYHKVIKSKLKLLARDLSNKEGMKVKVFVDTAPIMEKPLAELSGIGWFGKHSNIVSKKFGSWLFLGIILTDKEFPHNKKIERHCGKCNACIEICPTKAFDKNYKLDARKCISYLTIEHKTQIDLKYRDAIGNRIFGCDDCLSICPWNKFAKKHNEIRFNMIERLQLPPLKKLIRFDENKYRSFFSGTPVRRLGYTRFLRNVLIAIGNSKKLSLKKFIIEKLDFNDEIVKSTAIWSLYKIDKNAFKEEKVKRYIHEKSKIVKIEWERF